MPEKVREIQAVRSSVEGTNNTLSAIHVPDKTSKSLGTELAILGGCVSYSLPVPPR